jgi:hypothetical protein
VAGLYPDENADVAGKFLVDYVGQRFDDVKLIFKIMPEFWCKIQVIK